MRTGLAFLLAAASLCIAGCSIGGSERLGKAEYVAELEAAAQKLQTAVGASIDSNFTSPGPDEVAAVGDAVADDLEGMRPPAEVEDVHARLVEGLRESADDFRAIAEIGGESGDPLGSIERLSALEESELLEEAAGELERRGYDVPHFFGGSG